LEVRNAARAMKCPLTGGKMRTNAGLAPHLATVHNNFWGVEGRYRHGWQVRCMRRRNAIMVALSIIFLALLLALMVREVTSGVGTAGVLVVGGPSDAELLEIVVLSFPAFISVIITIILLVIEVAGSRGKLSR
jgi:hypothetical protein